MSRPTGYTLAEYGKMIICEPRMSAYAEALRRAVKPGGSVLDVGAGTGIFSLLACKYGATKVVAVEPDNSLELLPEIARANGCDQQLTCFKGVSSEFESAGRFDVIVSDLRGCLPIFEKHLVTIADVRDRLLAPGGVMIPRQDHIFAAVAECPEDVTHLNEPWTENRYGLDLSPAQPFILNAWLKTRVTERNLLSESSKIGFIDYYVVSSPDVRWNGTLPIKRRGCAEGIAVWFDTVLADEIGYSNAPGPPQLIYGQAFFPLSSALDVSEGDSIDFELRAKLIEGEYVYSWKVSARHASEKSPFANLNQSSFGARILSNRSAERYSEKYVPPINRMHEVERTHWALVNGTRSIGEIAQELHAQFPEIFESRRAALMFSWSCADRHKGPPSSGHLLQPASF